MPIDTSILLGAKGVDLPNPLDLAAKGLTVGNLANQNVLGGLQVQQVQQQQNLMQNPQYIAGISQLLAGGDPAKTEQLMKAISENPLAASQAFSSLLGWQKESATTQDLLAGAAEKKNKVQQVGIENLSNSAYGVLNSPTNVGFESMAAQMKYLKQAHGIDPAQYGINVEDLASGDPAKMFSAIQQLALLKTTPEKQATINNMPFEQWNKKAETQLKYLQLNKPEVGVNTLTGQQMTTTPYPAGQEPQMPPAPQGTAPLNAAGPGGPPAPGSAAAGPRSQIAYLQKQMETASPEEKGAIQKEIDGLAKNVSTAGSAASGRQVAPSAVQAELIKTTGQEVTQAVASAQAAAQLQEMLLDLRNREAKGMYSGAIGGNEMWRSMVNLAQAVGGLNQEQQDKLANSQAWSAEAKNLVAQAVKQFVGGGGRVAARELDYFTKAKPEELQTPQGREIVYHMLYNVSERIKQNAAQIGDWLDNGKHTSLLGFQPKFTDVTLPPLSVDQLPPPGQYKGYTAQGPQGTYRSDGTKWALVGPPQTKVQQIPQ